MSTENAPSIGHNGGPKLDEFADITTEIDDLFQTAKDFCDGDPISDQKMHDTIECIYDQLHEAGKTADTMRKVEKKPHDDAGKAVQAKFKPLLDGVRLGKEACQSLLGPWRKKIADEKAAAVERQRVAAEVAAEEARKALQESAGDLSARVEAEEKVAHAKSLERGAKRANKDATTGLGLRTIWNTVMMDADAALDWAYGKDPAKFNELAQSMAETAVRGGARAIPGFEITEDKVAA